MQERLTELHLQRGRLLERIAQQRRQVAVQVQPVARTLQVGDRLTDLFTRCKRLALQHPLVVAAAVATVVVLRPTGAWRLASRGLLAWRAWNALRGSLPGLIARFL